MLHFSRKNGGRITRIARSPTTRTLALIPEKYNPARIIVETSGSAFPAPIAIQIRLLTRENKGVHLDSIITVVDCVHFRGYEVGTSRDTANGVGYLVHGENTSEIYRC